MTHRALVVAALADGESRIHNPLEADDTRVTLRGLEALGIPVAAAEGCWTVAGRGGSIPGAGSLELGESGTSLRFLMAVAALGRSPSRLDGASRLRERPVHELADALLAVGGSVTLTGGGGGLPLTVGGSAPSGGPVRVRAGRSSQFASALLLTASRLPRGLDLTLDPPAVSLPYVQLTVEALAAFGVACEQPEILRFRVRPTEYAGIDYRVEGDHSTASYFLAAAAIVGGQVRVEGLDPSSSQPDARLGRLLGELGCQVDRGDDWIEVTGSGEISGFDLDLSEAPDLAPTIAVLGLFAEGPSVIRGVAHLRIKESDRLAALAANLTGLGRPALARDDRLEIEPARNELRGTTIRTESDHRIAMAFAIAGMRLGGVRLDDGECVAKSNPEFWEQLARLAGHH